MPTDLMATPTQLRRVLVVGSCLIAGLADIITQQTPNCKVDYFGTNNAGSLPPEPPLPADEYDFQVVQIALRSVLPDRAHMNLDYTRIEDYSQMFEETKERLSQVLQSIMQWNVSHGILTFVMNFLSPQQNLVGRLAPRYDIRNTIYFIDKLNMALADELLSYQNVYLFDTDQVVSTYGRRHYHDEILWVSSHGAALSDWDHQHDQPRLEATEPASKLYASSVSLISTAMWREMVGLYRTIQQVDSVKLVLIDLDDTLWRGVVGERDEVNIADREGWPLGFAEALRFLRRRGILLGIVSKNDESRALKHLRHVYGDVLAPEQFAIHRINWEPKIDNIQEILEELNLLPKNVIYIDDNPVERASVIAAFPEMRLLGGNPYLLRRILLWSPETQVATITAESSARTQMVQKQIERERQRKQMTRVEFLATLNIEASLFELTSIDHNQFSRAFELVNKTNQFNTTGKRWTTQEFIQLFASGGRVFSVEVSDRFTTYGLVAVCIFAANIIKQFVMSCRVIGLDVELAVVSALMTRFAGQAIQAELTETGSNLACRDVWLRCGFIESNGSWTHLGGGLPSIPTHIQMNDLKPE